MVEIKRVVTKKDLKKFVNFPIELYEDNPNWTCGLYKEEWDTLDKNKNPAFEWCEAEYFLALRDGKVVGRIGGIINHHYNEKVGEKRLRFTRPDFIDDEEVSGALIEAVENWGREKGMEKVHGPIGFCDLDKQGMLVEGFDRPGLTITVYNAAYYSVHFEKAGYEKEADWVEFRISMPEKRVERLERLAKAVQKRSGVRVLKLKHARQVRPYVNEVFDLLNETYAHLYGFVPLSPSQRDFYVAQFFDFLQLDYACFLMDKDDKIAAFGLAFPSTFHSMRKTKGKLFPFGFIPILREIRTTDTIEMIFIAIRKDMQGMGLNAVIINEVMKGGVKNGIRYSETGPELEENVKVQSQWKMFDTMEQHKRRRCYVKTL